VTYWRFQNSDQLAPGDSLITAPGDSAVLRPFDLRSRCPSTSTFPGLGSECLRTPGPIVPERGSCCRECIHILTVSLQLERRNQSVCRSRSKCCAKLGRSPKFQQNTLIKQLVRRFVYVLSEMRLCQVIVGACAQLIRAGTLSY